MNQLSTPKQIGFFFVYYLFAVWLLLLLLEFCVTNWYVQICACDSHSHTYAQSHIQKCTPTTIEPPMHYIKPVIFVKNSFSFKESEK